MYYVYNGSLVYHSSASYDTLIFPVAFVFEFLLHVALELIGISSEKLGFTLFVLDYSYGVSINSINSLKTWLIFLDLEN